VRLTSCLVVLAALIGFAQQSDSPPSADGVYYKTVEGWQKLEQLTMSGGGSQHVGKMFVPGLTPQMVWTVRGSQASLQLSQAQPRSGNRPTWTTLLAIPGAMS
jgi:hypothetical protein